MFSEIAPDANPTWSLHLVASVDGPILNAMMKIWPYTDPNAAGCVPDNEALNEGRFILRMSGDDDHGIDANDALNVGALGGTVSSLPNVIERFVDGQHYTWFTSADWYGRIGVPTSQVHVRKWTGGPEVLVTSAGMDPEGLSGDQFAMSGDTLFWTTATLSRAGINVWDPTNGTRPFIRWINDYTQGAADLGTDGVDMVWDYGNGKTQASEDPYPVRSIMTAPFTNDPTKINQRRLRSQPYQTFDAYPFVVGCGYAAHQNDGVGTLLVRISDGVSWIIGDDYPTLSLETPFGITCDEVFILGGVNGKTNIARVKIASLGPGTPPD